VPAQSGIDNRTFQKYVEKAVKQVFGAEGMPDAEIRRHAADSGYLSIDWEKLLGGQSYGEGFPSRRPDLQRRSAELLSALGPKVEAVQRRFAEKYG
jgi:hypothetical protein